MTHRTIARLLALPLVVTASNASAAGLDVLAETSLAEELGERPRMVDVDREGNIVVAGTRELLHLDRAGDPTGPPIVQPNAIDDVAIDRGSGNIAIAAEGELRLLDPGFEPLWQRALDPQPRPHRLAVGERGTIAVTTGFGVEVVAATGELRGRIAIDGSVGAPTVLDDHDLVVTLGSTTACGVERASLQAHAPHGALVWHAWGDDACDSAGAATHGVDVTRGEDGMLYALVEVEHGHDPLGAAIVGFDDTTSRPRIESASYLYYARFTAAGAQLTGQYLGFADPLSVVTGSAIAADREGNVHITGVSTHAIAEPEDIPGEADIVDLLDEPGAFHQVVAANFGSRIAWHALGHDAAVVTIAGDTVVMLVDHGAATSLVALPSAPREWEKRPDRDDVGTFGYESGVAGADPTCYCDASRTMSVSGWIVLGGCFLFGLGRRRRER